MKNHRILATFLLGTSLAVGAVVGLAPTSQAAPSNDICQKVPGLCTTGGVVINKTPNTFNTVPPFTIKTIPPVTFSTIPPVTLHTIPPVTKPPTTKPPTTKPPTTKPTETTETTVKHDDPKPSYPSTNPDAPVKGQPVFTG